MVLYAERHNLSRLKRLQKQVKGVEAEMKARRGTVEDLDLDEFKRQELLDVLADEEMEHILAKHTHLMNHLSIKVKKLTNGYTFMAYFFEVFECLRKVCLVGLPVFIEPGSVTQRAVGMILCFLTTCVLAFYEPYKDRRDNFLAILCQFQIAVLLVAGMVLKEFPDLFYVDLLLLFSMTWLFVYRIYIELDAGASRRAIQRVKVVGRVFMTVGHKFQVLLDCCLSVKDVDKMRETTRHSRSTKELNKEGQQKERHRMTSWRQTAQFEDMKSVVDAAQKDEEEDRKSREEADKGIMRSATRKRINISQVAQAINPQEEATANAVLSKLGGLTGGLPKDPKSRWQRAGKAAAQLGRAKRAPISVDIFLHPKEGQLVVGDLKHAVLYTTHCAAKYLSITVRELQAVMMASTPELIADMGPTAHSDASKRLDTAEASKRLNKAASMLFIVHGELAGTAYLLGVKVPQDRAIFVRSPQDVHEWKKLVSMCNAEIKVAARALRTLDKSFRDLPQQAEEIDLIRSGLQGGEISRLRELGSLACTNTLSLQTILGLAVAAGAATRYAPWVLKLTENQANLASTAAQSLAELVRAVKTTTDEAIANSGASWPPSPESARARAGQFAINMAALDTESNRSLDEAAAKVASVRTEMLGIASLTSFVDVSTSGGPLAASRRPKHTLEWKNLLHRINGEVASAVRKLRALAPLLQAASLESDADYLATRKDEQARLVGQLALSAGSLVSSLESLLSMVVAMGAHARFAPWITDMTARSEASSSASSRSDRCADGSARGMEMIPKAGGSSTMTIQSSPLKLSGSSQEANDAPTSAFSKDSPVSQRQSNRQLVRTSFVGFEREIVTVTAGTSCASSAAQAAEPNPKGTRFQSKVDSMVQLPGMHPNRNTSPEAQPAASTPKGALSRTAKARVIGATRCFSQPQPGSRSPAHSDQDQMQRTQKSKQFV